MDTTIGLTYKRGRRLLSNLRDPEFGVNPLLTSLEAWYPQPRKQTPQLETVVGPTITKALATVGAELVQSEAPTLQVQEAVEAMAFVKENGLLETYNLAKQLINSLVPGVVYVESGLEYDNETEERWVNFSVNVDAEVSEVLKADNEFTDRWLDSVLPEQSDFVRVNYKFSS